VNRFLDSVFGLGPFLIPISAIVIGGVIVVVKMILSQPGAYCEDRAGD